MLGSGSGIIPPSAVSAQAHASNMHITSAEKKQQTQNLNNRAINVSNAYCLRFHQLN
jgi:hypothetical protein